MAIKDYSNIVANARNKKKEDEKNSSSSSPAVKDYSSVVERQILSKSINFDTLSSDLTSLSKSVSNAYSGWQSRETLQNTLSSMQSMYDRLGKYQEYSKTYGGTDLTELRNTYKGIIDDWDSLSRKYRGYDNAEAYNKAVKDSAELYKKQSSADIGALQTEIKGLEDILKTVESHESNIRGLEVKRNTWEHRSNGLKTDMGYGSKVEEAQNELNKYLKSVGYDSVDALKKDLGDKKVFKTQAERLQNLNSLSSVGDKTSNNYDKDFEKYVASGQSIPTDEVGTSKRRKAVGHGRPANTPKVNDDLREVALAFERRKNGQTSSDSSNYYDRGAIFDLMTDEEFNNFYYYLGKDKEDGGNKAQEYVDSIADSLNSRRGEKIAKIVEDKPWGELGFSIEAGLDQWASGMKANVSDKDYIPSSPIQYASGIVRENVDYEYGDIARTFYDLGVTGANQLPSILVSSALGSITGGVGAGVGAKVLSGMSKGAGLATMGISARGNAYQEMLNLGYDKDQANTYANLTAASEVGLQALLGGIGKLGGTSGKIAKMVEGIDNGFARFAIQWGGSVASEATEEGLQEILNPLFQNIAAGYDTGAEVDWSEVAYSALLGGLMGGMFEGLPLATNSIAEHSHNKALGKDIKANDRVADVFDIASNPEVASAYDTYTRYANKGITADNISDAKLGRMYSMAEADAVDTLNSKKSTAEQKESALKTLARLSTVETENTLKKEAKKFNVGEETKVTESGDAIDIKGINIKGDAVTVSTDKGDVPVDDITLTQRDAELVVAAKGIAKTDGEDIANLFINQYDGETDVDAYANSFNLAMNYVKNNFPQETILENKGALSTSQVNAIYQATIINESNARETELENLAKKQGNTMTIQGVFDDAIIDYNSSTNDGSKVNWNSLTTTQRAAIKFAKLFSKATGVNIKFIKSNVKDGKHKGQNGSYDPATNTIEIDVYAGRIDATSVKDSIIPTLSHEITHWMKAKSPSIYNSIKEDVIKTLKERTGLSSDVIISKEIDRLKKNHPEKEHSVDEAVDEIVARACEDMLSNSNAARKLLNKMSASEQQSFIAKVKETFENLIQWVNDLLAHYKSTSEEAKILREYKHMLKKISKQWDEMLIKSIKTNQSLEKSGAFEHENTVYSDVLHSIREEYANEIEAWKKDGMPKGETFILGTTGDVLQGLGAIESDIYMLGDKIKYILNTHPEMTIEEIKKIPQILENPILILKSRNVGREKSSNTRLVIFGNVKAQDGKPILSVLDLRPTEKNLVVDDMQKVSSAYTKDVMPVDFVRNSLVVYADKKRTTKLLRTIGFKIPIELQQSGYIGSISYVGQNVNIKGEEFSKVFKDKDIRFSDRDTEYLELAKNPEKNEARLRELVEEAAKEAGYTDDSSWRMQHRAPNSKDDVSLANLKESELVPKDYWDHPEWYTHSAEERESYYKVKHALERQERYTAEGKPNEANIWVYRAVDKTKNKKEDYFRNGDWVTPSYDYAVNEGKMNPNGYRIIKHSVSIKHLYWDGNSIAELGYDDGNNYAYADTLNNRKLLDAVTYDDNGNVIPLSKRFKRRNWDVRYSERDTTYMEAVENGDIETASRLIEEAAERVFSNSKVRGSDGKLRLVYHGTVNDFTVFDRQFSNIEGDFGKGYYFTSNEYDVDANYANEEGPDLKNKIAQLAERLEWEDEYSDLSYEEREEIARQRFITSEPNTITAYLNMENPVYITPDEKGTFLDYNEEYDEEFDEYGEPEGLLLDFIEALKNNSYDYAYNDVDFSFLYEYASDGGMYASDAVKVIKERIVDELSDENGNLAINEVIRLAFEEIGFDGIIDTSVYYKFKNMSGMDSGTTHYIVFDSTQIKSADIATYDDNGNVIPLSQRFNTKSDDIRYSLRDEINSLPAEDKEIVLEVRKRAIYSRSIATMSEDRLSKAYDEYSYSNPSSTNGYLAYIEPYDFLYLTTTNTEAFLKNNPHKLNEGVSEQWGNENNIQKSGPLYLHINEEGKVVGHEGRHRMAGLLREGVDRVAVVIETSRVDNAKPISIKKLYGQDFGKTKSYSSVYVHNMLPISKEYENINKHIFGDVTEGSRFVEPNIRYSEREDTNVYDTMGETERILKENEKFKAEVERLKERLKIERQVTNGNYFNENQLGAVAGHLRNISKSLIAKDKLVDSLKDVYSYIAHSENLTWEEVFERCYAVAEDMIAEAKPLTIVDDYSKYLLREIRNTRISLDETQKKEAQHHFGKNWNRHFMGKVIITNDGINIDAKWQEWSNMYPEIFDAEINSQDMIGELYDIIENLREASATIDEYGMEEQKRWLAKEIYNQYWNVSPVRTTADKYDKQIRLLNFEHRRVMTEFREDYNTRLKEQHKADKEKQKKLVKEIRERKDKEIALAKQHGKEMMSKYKENAERKTVMQRVTANALSLNEMLVKNSKDKHVPEIMREPVTALLQAIDFSSKRLLEKGEPTRKDISLSKSLSKVKDMMVKATNAHNELVELYGHGLDEDIEKMVDSVDDIMRTVGDNEFILNKMTLTDLQTLDKMVKTIRHAVNKLNKFHTVNHAKGIANLSQESIVYLDSLGKGKVYDGLRGKSRKLLNWGNALPYYVFKRYGSGGIKVYEALQDGWDKFAFNTKKIMDYANESYTSKEVNEWSEEVKTFKILMPANEDELANPDFVPRYQEVQLTVSQIMSMHCLNKREQARGHLFKGGIRVADIKTKKGEIISQSEGIIFTEKDIATILNSLTGRQKEVADKLQRFMNDVCADWGNDVSMARFGYKAFGETNYFPIQSDKNNLAVNDETEQPNSLFRLLNMSFTKATEEKANNRIVVSDIFDVFAQHTSDMAKYNALALPVLDAFKWYNYTEKQDIAEGTFKTRGVKQSIETAFGKDGQSYFTTFLKDINGQQEVSRDTLGNGFFKNAKIAAVGMNLRVVLLQPTSYVRASAVIDNKYLSKALMHKPKIAKAEEHCGIALWKSMGYYDTNIQKGLEAQIKHADTWKDKVTDWSMKGAEVADKITWGYLWNACELEIRDTRKDLKVGSKEFYNAIAKRLREVIYATQVVDSTMTRSQMMRSSDGKDKLLTAFASEPTLSYNMVQDAYFEYKLDARRVGKGEAFKKHGKRIARVLTAYTMTNAVAALVESAFDALRDDDDEEMDMIKFMKLYFSNFASDMSITAKIPLIKEFHSFIKGFSSSRTDTRWMENITKAMTTWYKLSAEGKGKTSTAIKYSIKAISDLFGIPFYNVYRDTMATLNKLDLFTEEDLNEMFGDFFD